MINELAAPSTQHRTATAFAYEQLKRAILSGELPPGARLREQELVKWLDISRTPIREALRNLHTEGFVEVLSYKGAIVREFDVEEIREEYTLRAALEGLAAELAVNRLSEGDIETLEALSEQLERTLDAQDEDSYLEANQAFHFTLYQLSGSKKLVRGIDDSWKKVNLYRRLAYSLPGGWDEERDFHRTLLDACRARDGELARKLVQRSCLAMSELLVSTVQRTTEHK